MNKNPLSRHNSPLSATLSGIADLITPQRPTGALESRDRVDGLTCLVTGASSGLGKSIAIDLARRGGRVIVGGRTQDPRVRDDIVDAAGTSKVELEYLDLADLESVFAFCQRLETQGRTIDRCILNAGVVLSMSRSTVQGFEEMFAVNYLANFALATELLRRGVIPNRTFAAPKTESQKLPDGRIPRVIIVSSEAHRSAKPLDERELNGLGEPKSYDISGSLIEYSRNKLLLTTFFTELSRRLSAEGGVDVAVHAMCPGAVNTNIAREAPGWSQPLLRLVFSTLFRSPDEAAWPALYLSCSRAIEGRTGIYLHVKTRKDVVPRAADPEIGRKLWKKTEQLLEGALA